jgi:hypothetical protein
MNEPESKPMESAEADARSEHQAMCRQNNFLLTGLVALSVIVMGYLAIQWWRTSNDLQEVRPPLQELTKRNQDQLATLRNMVHLFVQFGQTNQEFQKVLAKYPRIISEYTGSGTNSAAAPQ